MFQFSLYLARGSPRSSRRLYPIHELRNARFLQSNFATGEEMNERRLSNFRGAVQRIQGQISKGQSETGGPRHTSFPRLIRV